jgi:nucleoside phosphorylase
VKKTTIGSGTRYIGEDSIQLLRCGMGGGCRCVLESCLSENNAVSIINVGTAGIVNPAIKTASIFKIRKFYNPSGENIILNEMDSLLESASMITVDQPLENRSLRDRYFADYRVDLVDMEGWYCAETARKRGVPFAAYKIASDYADENSQSEFMENYRKLMKKLAMNLIPKIEKDLI